MNYADTKQPSLLIADDDAAILRLVRSLAEGEGFQVMAANNGREAYRILKDIHSIDAAVVDINMPYIGGIDLVKFMHSDARFRDVPVIVMTGDQRTLAPAAGLKAGAVVFLPKPFTNSQLRTILRTLAAN